MAKENGNPTDWISLIALKRRANRSNVFIAESFDLKRLQQFQEFASKPDQLKDLFKVEFQEVYRFNLQRAELINLKNNTKLTIDPMTSPMKEIDNFLTTQRSLVVIDYICDPEHVRAISDWLIAWSQDVQIHTQKSTVLVFADRANLFSETLRRLSYPINIDPSSAEERARLFMQLKKKLKEGFKEKFNEKLEVEYNEQELVQASAGLDLLGCETCFLESFFKHRKIEIGEFTEYKVNILETYNLEYMEPKIPCGHVRPVEVSSLLERQTSARKLAMFT